MSWNQTPSSPPPRTCRSEPAQGGSGADPSLKGARSLRARGSYGARLWPPPEDGASTAAARLASGRWQASYWYQGRRHTAPRAFAARADALAFLSTKEAAVLLADGLWRHWAREDWGAGRVAEVRRLVDACNRLHCDQRWWAAQGKGDGPAMARRHRPVVRGGGGWRLMRRCASPYRARSPAGSRASASALPPPGRAAVFRSATSSASSAASGPPRRRAKTSAREP